MTTTPRPGETVSSYLLRCAQELLRRAGASEPEVSDYCEIFVQIPTYRGMQTFNGWKVEIAKHWLNEWRSERKTLAAYVREDRKKTISAGYKSIGVEAPVCLNGHTKW